MTSAKDRRLRIYMNTNAPWAPSGYGVFARDLLTRMAKDGWATAAGCFYGLEGATMDWNGIKCYPKMADTWGTDGMVLHAREFGAHVVMCFQDIWPLNPQFLQQIPCFVPYIPIDKDPVPQNVLSNLRYAHKILTYSRFGQEALEKEGFASTLILEGVDTALLKPTNKAKARAAVGLPQDRIIVGMIGANKENPPRKGWQEAIDAFKLFHDTHPEAAFFYHTNQDGGFPIAHYLKFLGLEADSFHFDEYHAIFHTTQERVRDLYNAFDMFILPSTSEGFGLPIVEAQACGCPVVVNNCTSMPELIIPGKTGETVDWLYKRFSPDGSWTFIADSKGFAEKMEVVWERSKTNPNKVRNDCKQNVKDNYDIDVIYQKQWMPLFERLQERLIPLTSTQKDTTINANGTRRQPSGQTAPSPQP